MKVELIFTMHRFIYFIWYLLILVAILVAQTWSRKPPIIRKYSATTY